MRPAVGSLPLLLLFILVTACATPLSTDQPPARHVILISIDGLRPEFYLDSGYPAPILRKLAASGARAQTVEPVFPSNTNPSHATILTGLRPNRHGIIFNVRFEPDGTRGGWYEDASELRAASLWMWARTAGLRTASINWPTTHFAQIDLLVTGGDYPANEAGLAKLTQATTTGLFSLARVTPSVAALKDDVTWDALMAATAAGLVRRAQPHLLLLHFDQTDHFQHQHGRDADEVKRAVGRVDGHLASILEAVSDAGLSSRTAVVVTGDHGFSNIRQEVFPNYLLARAGLRVGPPPSSSIRAGTRGPPRPPSRPCAWPAPAATSSCREPSSTPSAPWKARPSPSTRFPVTRWAMRAIAGSAGPRRAGSTDTFPRERRWPPGSSPLARAFAPG